MKNKINFIVPCAGYGTRAGLPFAKELYPLDRDYTLIDSLFTNISAFKRECRVIIIIGPHKTDLIKHLHQYADDFDIVFIYQRHEELAGAILSARDYFSNCNILLLPDIFISDENITQKLRDLILYTKQNKVCYLVKKESDFNILTRLGAVYTENNIIQFMEEKPKYNSDYNGFWVSIGFSTIDFIYDFITFQKNQELKKYDYFYNIPCVFVDYALDLGVWDNIRRFECDLAGKKLILKSLKS